LFRFRFTDPGVKKSMKKSAFYFSILKNLFFPTL